MLDLRDTSVVLPTLNERENIHLLINRLNSLYQLGEIIVVDDGSTDGTCSVVEKLSKKNKKIRFIKNHSRLGLTKSIQRGIDLCKSEFVVWMDADLSHPPELIVKFSQYKKTADIVIGSWLIPGGGDVRQENTHKTLSWLINITCQYLFSNRVHAYTSGFIFTNLNILKEFKLNGDYGEYCIDFIVRCERSKKKIVEVPFICRSRQYGHSKTVPRLDILIKRGFKYILTVFRLTLER